jgi:hypothetical protein
MPKFIGILQKAENEFKKNININTYLVIPFDNREMR